MTEHDRVAERYLASWNAVPGDRAAALSPWSKGATYSDPLMSGEGRDAIAAMMEAAFERFPGHHFVLRGAPEGHGPYTRFSWTLIGPAGEIAAQGTDVVRLDDNGHIAQVIGFLDGDTA